ncbi:MAG: hypothetical protein HN742_12940 [Lentisphaerae bacterium]|jgi:hypothetical protein|nr:hypothetical protein [Lentisphaerota bacterium]MBT7054929.1 hypothetical protein [Lentisphaerota bacterium]MBT7842776.1 hypothetical protein [Lentisphaerota bacterium]
MDITVETLRTDMLAYVQRLRLPDQPGLYRYSEDCAQPTLYSSTYVARIMSLFGALAALPDSERQAWAATINGYQDDDGLYRDPVIYGEGWYADDPLWCGRTHLTGHVLGALGALGAVAPRPFAFLAPYRGRQFLEQWLVNRDWGARVAYTGNEVCNIGRLLQYSRDYHNDSAAGRAVSFLLDWLAEHRFNPATGLWGNGDPDDPIWLSHAVQGAYHWWILFFYDRYPLREPERTLDTLLRTQNPRGGFGWGVHNPQSPHESSACEDIDSIHPLAQLAAQTPYRRDEVERALVRAAKWVLSNRVADGGFAFIRERAYSYGHSGLSNAVERSGLFPTWFRLLSLALIGKALPKHPLGRYAWHFDNCPGPQIWIDA